MLSQSAAIFKSTLHCSKKIMWTPSQTSDIAKKIINRRLSVWAYVAEEYTNGHIKIM